MCVIKEFQTTCLILLTDCTKDNVPYLLATAANRSRIKRESEYIIILSLTNIFFQKTNLIWSIWYVIGMLEQKYCNGLTLSRQQQLKICLKQLWGRVLRSMWSWSRWLIPLHIVVLCVGVQFVTVVCWSTCRVAAKRVRLAGTRSRHAPSPSSGESVSCQPSRFNAFSPILGAYIIQLMIIFIHHKWWQNSSNFTTKDI